MNTTATAEFEVKPDYSRYYRPVDMKDAELFEQFGVVLDASTLQTANTLLDLDHDLRPNGHNVDADTKSRVNAVRHQFMSIIGLQDATHHRPKDKEGYTKTGQIKNILAALRVYHESGIDTSKAATKCPEILGLTPVTILRKIDDLNSIGLNADSISEYPNLVSLGIENIRQKIEILASYGIDTEKVLVRCPAILASAPETIIDKISNIQENGLDPKTVITEFPRILSIPKSSLNLKMDNLEKIGLPAQKVVSKFTEVIGMATATLDARLQGLRELELDALRVVSIFPSIIGYRTETIKSKIDSLDDMGLNAVAIFNSYPSAITFAVESVREKLRVFEEAGLDGVSIINRSPSIIGSSPAKVKLICYWINVNKLDDNYLAKINSGKDPALFNTPIESLLLMDPARINPDRNLSLQSKKNAQSLGFNNTTERKDAVREMLSNDPKARKRLGYVAVLYAAQNNIPWGHWATIDSKPDETK